MRAAFAAITAAALLLSTHASANLLSNPSFEDPITADGAPFVGFWEGFSGAGTASSDNGMSNPRTGDQHAEISIVDSDNSFAGLFQDVPGLTPGTMGVFSGWHATPSDPLDVGVEIRIEWRDSVAGVEVSRTPNISDQRPTGLEYTPFELIAEVPAGADTARVVYAIQTFGGDGPTNTGTVHLDDLSFVPEPASVALLGLGALGILRRRA